MKEKLIKESEVDKLIEQLYMALDKHTASSEMVDMSVYVAGLSFAAQVIKKEYRGWKEKNLKDKKISHED